MAPHLDEDTTPWPTPAYLEARRAPAQSVAQPWQIEGLVRRQQAHPISPSAWRLSHFQPPGRTTRALSGHFPVKHGRFSIKRGRFPLKHGRFRPPGERRRGYLEDIATCTGATFVTEQVFFCTIQYYTII